MDPIKDQVLQRNSVSLNKIRKRSFSFPFLSSLLGRDTRDIDNSSIFHLLVIFYFNKDD